MPYRYLTDIAIADAAFEAWGDTMEELFIAASDATTNVMVEDLGTIHDLERRSIEVEENAVDMLLFQLLQELVFYKDAEQLLLRVSSVQINRNNGSYHLHAQAYGEQINPEKHELLVDVKAVTLHRFQVEQTSQGWKAIVILDT